MGGVEETGKIIPIYDYGIEWTYLIMRLSPRVIRNWQAFNDHIRFILDPSTDLSGSPFSVTSHTDGVAKSSA